MKTSLKWALLSALFVFYSIAVSAQKPPKPASPPKLHVIYMLEQEDPAFGLLNLGNDELMTQITKTVGWALGYPMQVTYLSKSDFTQATLRQTITGLKTQPNDIIILYYSGFGILSAQNTGNFANWKLHDAPMQGLAVTEVEKWLLAKKVHLSLLIADCSAQILKNQGIQSIVTEQQDPRKQVIQRLFLDNCGLVKIGSSLPWAPSWVNSAGMGTVFTGSLNRAFQDLLLTNTPADLARISFQRINTITENYMKSIFGRFPFNQAPVLEVQSCRSATQQVVKQSTGDLLNNGTLNSLLNAMASKGDSSQRQLIQAQLLGLSQANTRVDVSRFFPSTASDTLLMEEDLKFHKNYSLQEYLDQLQRPLSYLEGGTSHEVAADLVTITITGKEVDKSATKPIKHLTIREDWAR